MPIDPDFPKNHHVIGQIKLSDGEHFHFLWGPGKLGEASENAEVKEAFQAKGEANRANRCQWHYGSSGLGFMCSRWSMY